MSHYIDISKKEIVWEWQDRNWYPFDKYANDQIESAYKTNPQGEVTVTASNRQQYRITFYNMMQQNLSSYYRRPIRRREKQSNVQRVNVAELKAFFDKYKSKDEDHDIGKKFSFISVLMVV